MKTNWQKILSVILMWIAGNLIFGGALYVSFFGSDITLTLQATLVSKYWYYVWNIVIPFIGIVGTNLFSIKTIYKEIKKDKPKKSPQVNQPFEKPIFADSKLEEHPQESKNSSFIDSFHKTSGDDTLGRSEGGRWK